MFVSYPGNDLLEPVTSSISEMGNHENVKVEPLNDHFSKTTALQIFKKWLFVYRIPR